MADTAYVLEPVDVEDEDFPDLKFEEVPQFEADDPDDFRGVFSSIHGEEVPTKSTASPYVSGSSNSTSTVTAPFSTIPSSATVASSSSSDQFVPTAELMCVEDFVRNFLVSHDMKKTLDAFQTEWFHLHQNTSNGANSAAKNTPLPRIYQQYEELQKEVAVLKQTAAAAVTTAAEAKGTWAKFRRERDVHRMHHRRLVQEKNDLVTDLKRLNKHAKEYQPALDALQKKYEQAMKERMLMRLEKSKLQQTVQALQAQLAALSPSPHDTGVDGASAPTSSASNSNSSASTGDSSSLGSSSKFGKSSLAASTRFLGKTLATTTSSSSSSSSSSSLSSLSITSTAASQAATGALSVNDAAAAARTSVSIPEAKAMENYAHLFPTTENPFKSSPPRQVNLTTAIVSHSFKAHKLGVPGVALSPTAPVMATASDDMTWKIWSLPKGELIMAGEGHKSWLSACTFHPSGSLFGTAGADHYAKVWDLAQQRCAAKLAGHTQPIWDMQFHHGGHLALTGSLDQTARLWDLHTGYQLHSFRGHVDSVNKVRWIPYSSLFVTASGDKTISVWDARTGLCVQSLFGHYNAVQALDVDLTGRTIVSGDADGVVKVWDIVGGQARAQVNAGSGVTVNSVRFEPAGTAVAVALDSAKLSVYSIESTGLLLQGDMQTQDASSMQDLVISSAGDYAVGGTLDGSVVVWQL